MLIHDLKSGLSFNNISLPDDIPVWRNFHFKRRERSANYGDLLDPLSSKGAKDWRMLFNLLTPELLFGEPFLLFSSYVWIIFTYFVTCMSPCENKGTLGLFYSTTQVEWSVWCKQSQDVMSPCVDAGGYNTLYTELFTYIWVHSQFMYQCNQYFVTDLTWSRYWMSFNHLPSEKWVMSCAIIDTSWCSSNKWRHFLPNLACFSVHADLLGDPYSYAMWDVFACDTATTCTHL